MRFLLFILFPVFVSAQNVTINGTGSTLTINAPGQTGVSFSPSLDSRIRDLILISGQSNAGGEHAFVTDNSVLVPFDFIGLKTKIFVMQTDETFLNQNIPNPATTLNPLTGVENWSAEQHTVQNLPIRYNRNVYMFRKFSGGTSIVSWTSGGSVQDGWEIGVGATIDSVVALGFTPRITIIWIQGESDTDSEAEYSAYESRLRTVIANTKALRVPHTTNLRWISCKLASTLYTSVIGGQTINAAFDAVAADEPGCYAFDPATVVTPFGGIHYTKDGYMEFSEGLWEWLLSNNLL